MLHPRVILHGGGIFVNCQPCLLQMFLVQERF